MFFKHLPSSHCANDVGKESGQYGVEDAEDDEIEADHDYGPK